MKAKGFTLIEVMIVLVIWGILLGILLAVAIPAYQDHEAKNRCDGDQNCIQQVDAYRSKTSSPSKGCYHGYSVLPNGGQLIDSSGHGVPCTGGSYE